MLFWKFQILLKMSFETNNYNHGFYPHTSLKKLSLLCCGRLRVVRDLFLAISLSTNHFDVDVIVDETQRLSIVTSRELTQYRAIKLCVV